MKMKEFAEIIKRAHIKGDNQKNIIYQLFQALGAKEATSVSGPSRVSYQSPSPSTIQSWLSGKTKKPRVSSYFPNHKIENKEGAYIFFKEIPNKNKWKELRDLFKEWYDNNQNKDQEFYINTETDELDVFIISFWRQFVSYFAALRLWDGAEEQYLEIKDNREKDKNSFVNEMIEAFKENFVRYKVYEFIPKEINTVISSLNIYSEIWKQNTQLSEQNNAGSGCGTVQNLKNIYCKWVPDFDGFIFGATTCYKCFMVLETSERCIVIKCGEYPAYDLMQTDTWLFGNYKYTFVSPSIFQDEQFDERAFSWKEGQGEIVIIDVKNLFDQFEVEKPEPIFADCYMLIDRMLEGSSSIDKFITVTKEKIIKKYKGVAFDNSSRILYNTIEQYGESLKKFKKCLAKFRNLKKEKSEYLESLMLKKSFDIYSAFDNYEVPPKPKYPFSECYLDEEKACKIKSELRHYHKSLIELYTEIFCYGENYIQ